MNVGKQIAENLITHKKMKKKEALEAAVELLRKVGIPQPEKEFPNIHMNFQVECVREL